MKYIQETHYKLEKKSKSLRNTKLNTNLNT